MVTLFQHFLCHCRLFKLLFVSFILNELVSGLSSLKSVTLSLSVKAVSSLQYRYEVPDVSE